MFAARNALMTSGPGGVTFDSVGGVAQNPSPNPNTWSHTLGASANRLIVPYQFFTTVGFTATFKVGSTTITSNPMSANWYSSGGFFGYIGFMEIANPPTGAQTMSVQFTGGAPYNFTCTSMAYNNVGSLGTAAQLTGTGTALSHTATSASSKGMIAHFATHVSGSGSFTGYNRDQRAISSYAASSSPIIAGDSPDLGSNVAFTATTPTTDYWSSIVIPMLAP